mmetsp:Transcript_51591/g.129607  ORF Transcript_51591/g.129607 Transcript_51591/m.129607 type:complete len:329 (+) Transcript_51591:729-1715(+)
MPFSVCVCVCLCVSGCCVIAMLCYGCVYVCLSGVGSSGDRPEGAVLVLVSGKVSEVGENRRREEEGLPLGVRDAAKLHLVVVHVGEEELEQVARDDALEVSDFLFALNVGDLELDLLARAAWQWAPEAALAARRLNVQHILALRVRHAHVVVAAVPGVPHGTDDLTSSRQIRDRDLRSIEAVACARPGPVQMQEGRGRRARHGRHGDVQLEHAAVLNRAAHADEPGAGVRVLLSDERGVPILVLDIIDIVLLPAEDGLSHANALLDLSTRHAAQDGPRVRVNHHHARLHLHLCDRLHDLGLSIRLGLHHHLLWLGSFFALHWPSTTDT